MATVKSLHNSLWSIDPGYFNLKQACKTILAIAVSLWIVRDATTLTKLLAGLASGFSMEGIVAKTWPGRLVRVLALDFSYFAGFSLGLFVRDSANLTALTLVALGFLVNYIRRFNLESSMAPMKVWLLCFLATILPFTHAGQAWAHIHGLLVGLLVSAVITFIFPENYPRLLIDNTNRFFSNLAQGLRDMRLYVLVPVQETNFTDLSFFQTKMILMELIDSSQTIQPSKVFAGKEKEINSILIYQYGLLSAYSLMVDAYHTLWKYQHQISRPSQVVLSQITKQFAQLFTNLTMDANYKIVSDCSGCFLPNLAQRLGKTSLTDPMLVMVLLNLKLSFDLLNHHIKQLLQDSDEA